MRFRPDPSIFTYQPSSKLVFSPQLADLVYLSPGLTWRFLDEKQEGLSLRERVAQLAHRKSTLVAHARTELDCALGPIDIEVAITWPSSSRPAGIESFVNYRRADDGGSHIAGMLDGIGKFVGSRKRNATIEQLVAGVSIVLADVKFGTPLHRRLVTPEVRPVVAAATRCALETFAAREPAAAAHYAQRFVSARARSSMRQAPSKRLADQGLQRRHMTIRARFVDSGRRDRTLPSRRDQRIARLSPHRRLLEPTGRRRAHVGVACGGRCRWCPDRPGRLTYLVFLVFPNGHECMRRCPRDGQ